MATEEQVCAVIERFKAVHGTFLKRMDKTTAGMGHLLRYLSHADRPVSAGEISSSMQVSTARVAVLLKRMEERGFIVRQDDPDDARKTLVSISEQGKVEMAKFKTEMFATMTAIVDKIGYERMLDFIDTVREINDLVAAEMEKGRNGDGR